MAQKKKVFSKVKAVKDAARVTIGMPKSTRAIPMRSRRRRRAEANIRSQWKVCWTRNSRLRKIGDSKGLWPMLAHSKDVEVRKDGSMPYIKIVVLLCSIAVLLAVAANLLFFSVSLLTGSAFISATRTGWTLLLLGWWTLSFFVGIRIAMALKIFPFSFPG